MNLLNISLEDNEKFVLQHMLPNLVHDLELEFSQDNYVGFSGSVRVPGSKDILQPILATGRAFTAGAGLAAVDGPLPFMDVVGFGVAVTVSVKEWYDYFS